ncbi:DUF2062 domain-containing protein [Novosphingobium sp.]|uniref:DUF2062 domain-containing protein n=1 Tax=Novosphingobium sp. TaxID=1874826 RepID=UPI00263524EF|nr:DUF2062 domain-containing protein [Novosphingobium sp.]
MAGSEGDDRSGMKERVSGLARRMVPTREALVKSRFVRPLAARPELWRYNRRSVPRGIAVGLFVGIFAMIPGVQIVGAALMCVPFRGNIPLAAGATLLSNPATTPMILLGALWVGGFLGLDADFATFQALIAKGAGLGEWAVWLVSSAAPAMVLGLLAIATVSALVGYGASILIWRWWTARRRRMRLGRGLAGAREV